MQRYMLSSFWKAGTDSVTLASGVPFRPTHIKTNVTAEGVALITGIYLNEDKHSQLLVTVDAYQWSMALQELMRKQFYEEHGLSGKSFDEIDSYLDEHELSVPDPGRIDLPTMTPNSKYRFTGEVKADIGIMLVGWA
jgi:hypothetical protein